MDCAEAEGLNVSNEKPDALLVTGRRRRLSVLAALVALTGTVASPDDEHPEITAPSADIRQTLGFYPGFADADSLRSLERDLGFELRVVVQFGGQRDPTDLTGGIHGQLEGLSDWIAERDPLYSVTIPLAFGDAQARTEQGVHEIVENLDETAAGAHDSAYTRVANYLVEAGLEDAVLRVGHEFDGNWYPWSARASCERYIAAFRHVTDVFRSVSPTFRIEWTGTLRNFPTWGECAYPGDEYVDIAGLDVYDQGGPMSAFSQSDGSWIDPAAVWVEQFLPRLEFHHDFAREHGKPVSYPEWAIVTSPPGAYGGDNPIFIRSMAVWLRSLPSEGPGSLTYHAYFVGVSDFDFRTQEQSAIAFYEEFGRPG